MPFTGSGSYMPGDRELPTDTRRRPSIITRLFSSTSKGSQDAAEPKGPLGLTTLHVPSLGQTPSADIIFVHGVNGGSYSTWTMGNRPDRFWPQQWLPEEEDFKDVRIHTFGYPAGVTRESIISISDIARSLLAAIKDAPVMRKGRQPPLIFVAHSMGGLVVKKAYITGCHEPEFKSVVDRVCSIFFLATPHQGASIAQTFSRLTAAIGARPFVEDLFPQSSLIQAASEDFPRVSSHLELFSFYETRPMTVGIKKMLIVEKSSSVMNLPNERRTLLDADHRNVAMYSSPKDPSYVAVRNALAAVVSSHRGPSRRGAQVSAEEDRDALSRFLGVYEAPEDDLMIYESVKAAGSCEWLTTREYYRSWKASRDSGFLWLRGRPGAGKTVLATHIISDLRRQGLDCCFFFFQAGDNIKSTANASLRSMAWQMAMLHPGVFDKLKAIMSEWRDGPIDTIDSRSMWRKIFLSGILKVQLESPQFWVIDAMDECQDPADMVSFLTRIQEHWPLSAVVTSRDAVDANLKGGSPNTDIQGYTISEQDTLGDISLLLQANLAQLPCSGSTRWPTPEAMASHILEMSEGCFLWASLICSELRQVTSEREIIKAMESTPSDMDAVYRSILAKMQAARFGKATAKAFIAWTAYAFRPLSVDEIRTPIEMDIDDKIDDVQRAISRCSGGLVYVDQRGKVRLVHLTAREFLTRQGVESEFIVPAVEGHRRLATVCLRFLLRDPQNVDWARELRSVSDSHAGHSRSPSHRLPFESDDPFTDYASHFVFQHLHYAQLTDELLVLLSDFLGSRNVLGWIELNAATGNLRTVYEAGKTIKGLLGRRNHHSPSHERLTLLEKWADDLMHVITKFSGLLRRSPKAIHHLIPPFCPADSAIRSQFTSPVRGLSVQGLSSSGWGDCLTTITFPSGVKPNALAAGPGYFAVGLMNIEFAAGRMNIEGLVLVYDDTTCQGIHALRHGEPVNSLAFSESGKLLASAGKGIVRVWSLETGSELSSFTITSQCLSLGFAEEDTVLRVVTTQRQLIEWDVKPNAFLRDQPLTWEADLPEIMQGRVPKLADLDPTRNLLAIMYPYFDIVFWDWTNKEIYDVYEKDTGSTRRFGRKLPGPSPPIAAGTFSHASDMNLFAAAYYDGVLHVYDISKGEEIASEESANAQILASSRDGRTLAAACGAGTVTLYEFETLRPLHRFQLETGLCPSSLAFTSDSRRIIEISGNGSNLCRVWEPPVLLRSGMHDDADIETVSVSTLPQGSGNRDTFGSFDGIRTITCCRRSGVVFCGMSDGSVYGYDIAGQEPERQLLFVQGGAYDPIVSLHFDEESSILACASSTRFTVRKIKRHHHPRQREKWEIGSPLIDRQVSDGGGLTEVLVSPKHERILVSTRELDMLWSMPNPPNQGEGTLIQRIEDETDSDYDASCRWITRPDSSSDSLLRIGPTKQEISVYDWSTLTLLRVVSLQLDDEIRLGRFAALTHCQYLVAYTKRKDETRFVTGARKVNRIFIWNLDDFENGAETIAPQAELGIDGTLPSRAEHVIGIFGAHLVFFTEDHWIASVELPSAGSPGGIVANSFVRHFFLPNGFLGSRALGRMISGIGWTGEIVFARRDELAVIKRGLEITEDGGTFHPRRLNNQQRGRFPVGHRVSLSAS
ncbi:hypothetical protein VTK56DRAFT_2983 [Thermocarpiscus australiensis]